MVPEHHATFLCVWCITNARIPGYIYKLYQCMVCSSIAETAIDMTGDLHCKNSCLRHGSLIYLIYFVNRNLKERVFPLIYLLIYFVNRKFSYTVLEI